MERSRPRRGEPAGIRHRIARGLSAASVGLGLCAIAHGAEANGRYPTAQQLVVDPTDASRLWLRATYGILTSPDAGKSWDWICEPAAGYSGRQDPMLAATATGKVFVAAEEGLLSTSDRGCAWSANEDIGKDRSVIDIAVESDRRHVLALVLVPRDDAYDLAVYRSDEQSEHFAPLGPPIAGDLLGETLDPAPSDPNRIYVTGSTLALASADGGSAPNGPAVLMRTRDGGSTWERVPIPGASLMGPAFIAAVHPTNPDIVYVRVQGEPKAEGTIESHLLYTEDAGDSWKEVFRGSADMLGFSLSDDGSEVLVGLGDAYDPNGDRQVDPAALGIYRASAPAFSFARVSTGQVSCLTRASAGLFVCGNHAGEHFEVGLSQDDGATASPLIDLGGVRGPLDCGETRTICQTQWMTDCSLLGTCSTASSDAGAGALGQPATADPLTVPHSACSMAGARRDLPAVRLRAIATAEGFAALLFMRRRRTARRYQT